MTYDPLPQKQILSYQVRGPELEAIMSIFQQQGERGLPLESLVEKFVPLEGNNRPTNTELLREALNFLRAVEFIRQRTDETQNPILYLAEQFSIRKPFTLQLIRRLHSFEDDRRAFRLVMDLVVRENLFFAHRRELVTKLESNTPGSYSWNEEKIRTWQQLADYLGLVRSIEPSQGDTMFSPQPHLLLGLMHAYVTDHHPPGKQIPMGDWLTYLEENYITCLTGRREVHLGLARSLKSMETMGKLTFVMHSDAPQSVILDGQRVAYLKPTAQMKE